MKSRIIVFILALCVVPSVYGQKGDHAPKKFTLKGIVTNKNGQPVEGAVIFLDTLCTRTESGENGEFRVKCDPAVKSVTAVVEGKGFGQAQVSGVTSVKIVVLKNPGQIPWWAARALNQNQMASKDHRLKVYPNIYEMIREEVPGVTVSGTSITIKQGHSFFGSSTPVYVVNGVKVPSIDNIFPEQVKKIEVLTGSDALIYTGVDGTTGVLKITLKAGGDL